MNPFPESIRLLFVWCVCVCLATISNHAVAIPTSNCTTALDCQLLGECQNGKCVCDAGWMGATCGTLRLGTSTVIWPSPQGRETTSSWGASILKHITPAGIVEHHLYTDTVCRRFTCAHTVSAQIVHSSTSSGVNGPFDFKSVAIPSELENIHAAIDPSTGTVLLYYGDHNYSFPNGTCTGQASRSVDGADRDGYDPEFIDKMQSASADGHRQAQRFRNNPYPRKSKAMGIAYSTSLDGPFTKFFPSYEDSLKQFLPLNNPSPMFLPNGTVLLAFRYSNHNLPPGVGETNALAIADSWQGPYRLVSAHATPVRESTEDPFLFHNKRGLHMVFHCYRGHRDPPNETGCHTFSNDGGKTWTVSSYPVYTTTVMMDNGSTVDYNYRERPEILFDDNGVPQHLLTGVETGLKNNDYPNCASVSISTTILSNPSVGH